MSGARGKDQILAENEEYVSLYFHSGIFYRTVTWFLSQVNGLAGGERVVGSRGRQVIREPHQVYIIMKEPFALFVS